MYKVGDLVPLDMGTEGLINMQIVGINVDDLADGSGKAPISWVSKELLKTKKTMNPALVTNDDGTYQEGTGGIGGWEKSEMRTYLKETIKPLIRSDVLAMIKEVNKYSGIYNTNGTQEKNVMSKDDVWIPSYRELTNSTTYESGNTRYDTLYTNRIKKNQTNSNEEWWLRSASAADKFSCVGSNGYSESYIAHTNRGVAIGFCT